MFNTSLLNRSLFGGVGEASGGSEALAVVNLQGTGAKTATGGAEAELGILTPGTGSKVATGGSGVAVVVSIAGAGGQPASGGSGVMAIATSQGTGLKVASAGSGVTAIVSVIGDGGVFFIPSGGSGVVAVATAVGTGTKTAHGGSEAVAIFVAETIGTKLTFGGAEVVAHARARGVGGKYVNKNLSVKIAGVERRQDLQLHRSVQISHALTYEIDVCSFEIKGDVSEGEEVIIEQAGIRHFAGVVVKTELVKAYPKRGIKVWKVDCDDYTALLDRRLVVESYENISASDIFTDIVAKYCPGFTVDGVMPGAPIIESTGAEFEYKRPSECFKWLCDYVGWHWEPDYHKDLRFFDVESLTSPAPMKLIPGGLFRFGKHTIDTQGLRNRVYVRGGTMLSDPQTVQWKADGVARHWVLPWGPHETSLAVGEAPKSVGVENLHEESDYDYMMSFTEKYIRCSSHTPTPVEGVTMSLVAKQDIAVITMVEDYASQSAIAAVQGGDGVYEHVIADDSLATVQAAEAAGMADLREHGNPKVSGNFETEVAGWYPGQLVEIDLPDRGVVGTYLVQRVDLFPAWSNPPMWTHKIEYGGKLLGIAGYLKALVSSQQKKRLLEPAQSVHKFEYSADVLGVQDELYTTLKTLPYICGDEDAICGLVVVSDV